MIKFFNLAAFESAGTKIAAEFEFAQEFYNIKICLRSFYFILLKGFKYLRPMAPGNIK